jgi:predicted negative regulator of RcsB-dependent stress response
MDEEDKKKFWDKAKESPFVPIGILGTLGMIGYGVYDFKNRGSMSASVYIMQYRVKAQSVIVGAMAIGVTISVIKDLLKKKENPVE